MAENSGIEWTTHTFNPWWGCTKVGPGCDHCYAETFDRRVGGEHWGSGAPRRLVNDWSKPRKWDREAEKSGIQPWVFCASMADVFDNEVPAEWRERLWDLVRECRNLRWQFVTKRIGNVSKMLPSDWPDAFPHCGLLSTIVNQEEADRDIPKLLTTPAAWRGLSMEPLLGDVDLVHISTMRFRGAEVLNGLTGELGGMFGDPCAARLPRLDWDMGKVAKDARGKEVYGYGEIPADTYPRIQPSGALYGTKAVKTITVDALFVASSAWISANEGAYDKLLRSFAAAGPDIKKLVQPAN